METLESIFSSESEIVEKLKGFAQKPDYKKIFFEHLGPELTKIFMDKKDKIFFKNFFEASQYEYGFFGNEIDLPRAFSLYKKYADLNDVFCMYKMHVIYLCENEKFNVPFSRVLEKIYIIKCLAYVPNYIYDWDIKLFETIDVVYEMAQILDLEDGNLTKHQKFFDLLFEQKEKYNLSENAINLMKGVFFCYFHDESEFHMISFCTMNSLIPNDELDLAYYYAKNKCVFFNTYLKLENAISDSEIKKFYKDVETKKLYELYGDYGNYLLDQKTKANPEITKIFISAAKKGYLFNSFRAYQCLIDYYDFDEIMEDYNKAENILDYLLEEIVFENIANKPFILLIGFLIKYSKFPEKIISKYLVYIKEINDHVNSSLIKKEKEKLVEEDEYLFVLKGYIYLFGFEGIEKQNLFKAVEYLDIGSNVTEKMYIKKNNEFIKYRAKKLMHNLNLITTNDLIQAKKDIIKYYSSNLKLKFEINDCYVIGEDYYEGITKKKDEMNTFLIYKSALNNIFCKSVSECRTKNEIKKFLKNHEYKTENKLKDEICCICYDKKISKTFIPCKHCFCSVCAIKLEKESKCPICRSEILCVI